MQPTREVRLESALPWHLAYWKVGLVGGFDPGIKHKTSLLSDVEAFAKAMEEGDAKTDTEGGDPKDKDDDEEDMSLD